MRVNQALFATFLIATKVFCRSDEEEDHRDACKDRADDLGDKANDDPQPSGELRDWFNDHGPDNVREGVRIGVIYVDDDDNCDFTSELPESLTSTYNAFLADVTAWADTYKSIVSEAEATCDHFPGSHKARTNWPTECAISEVDSDFNATDSILSEGSMQAPGIIFGVLTVAGAVGAAAILL